jgi:hypothetical protein
MALPEAPSKVASLAGPTRRLKRSAALAATIGGDHERRGAGRSKKAAQQAWTVPSESSRHKRTRTNDDYRSNSLRPRPSFRRRSASRRAEPGRRLEDAHEPSRSRLPCRHVQLEHLGVDALGGGAERCRLPWLAVGEVVGYDVR